jgi:drug/metabolite transporter (DMT)-like permease
MSDIHMRSVTELLGDLASQVSALFRKEIQLARAEVGEKIGEAGSSVGFLAAGGIMALAALIVLLFALVAGLVEMGLEAWLAGLIVGVVVALAGYALLRTGLSRLKASNLTPRRTAEQLSRDAAAAKETVR